MNERVECAESGLGVLDGAKVSCGFQAVVDAVEGARERVEEAVDEEREERKEERREAREKAGRRGGRAEWRIAAAAVEYVSERGE